MPLAKRSAPAAGAEALDALAAVAGKAGRGSGSVGSASCGISEALKEAKKAVILSPTPA